MLPSGTFITAKAAAADLTTAFDLTWVDMNGLAVVPAANERIVLYSMTIGSATAVANLVTVFQDTDAGNDLDATEIMEQVHVPAAIGSHFIDYSVPVPCRLINAAGTNDLHIIAAAAATISYIIRARLIRRSS
jgi:hypothetical protein